MPIPKVLVIAGSDSSGGAGLEADQKTLAAHGCYAMTATTALTAQNTMGVEDVHIIPPAFVGKQIRKVMEDGFLDGEPGVVKMGMLASAETISFVARTLKEWQEKTGKEIQIVLDPVMVATSGAQLLPGDAVSRLRSELLPMTTVLTPNIPEATLLLRDADIQYRTPSSLKELKALAKTLHSLGPKHILLKGGHMPLTKDYMKATTNDEKAITVDILYPSTPNDTNSPDAFTTIESTYLTIPNTHGTGCSLASALAANLASSSSTSPTPTLSTSVRSSVNYVSNGILTSPYLQSSLHNHGPGPINHFHSLLPSPFPLGHFVDYLLSHPRISPIWNRFIHHPFTYALGSGTLPLSRFKNYLIQDYIYLTHFARTYALAGYKSTDMTNIARSAEIILHIQKEMEMHLDYCAEFGISKEKIEGTRESLVGTAYSRYVLDVGMRGDVLGLYVALGACLIGYGEVAGRLAADGEVEVGTGEVEAKTSDEDGRGATQTTQTTQKAAAGQTTASKFDVTTTNETETGQGGNAATPAPKPRSEPGHGTKHPPPNKTSYSKWIANYTSPAYLEAVRKGRASIEDEVRRQGGLGRGRVEELVEVFRRATEMEIWFWNGDGEDDG